MNRDATPPSRLRDRLWPGRRPAWFVVLLLVALSSLAVAAGTTSGQVSATVASRLAFGTPVAGKGTVISLVGTEHFEAQFVAYIDEPVNFTIPVRNEGGISAIAVVSCDVPEGLVFSASTSGEVMAIGGNEYAALIPAGGTLPFNLWFLGEKTG